jgi:hypothetical protein
MNMIVEEENKKGGYMDMPYYYRAKESFTLEFAPKHFNDVGLHKFRVNITDSLAITSDYMILNITNSYPHFVKNVPPDMNIRFNNTFSY